MHPKRFLLLECKNISFLLDQTLKHDYGLDGSHDFYNECAARLSSLKSDLELLPATNASGLNQIGLELNELTNLICRIERSFIGEYSWPFVDELKNIAEAICIEDSLAGDSSKIYVLADAGLDAYRIFPEPKRPSFRGRLLLTIVFPKTLKDFVLLHSILGHELGHGIWRCSKHEKTIRDNVLAKFVGLPGAFQNPAATARHIYSASAPHEAKASLNILKSNLGIDEATFFGWANWNAWIEEILCDFVGLTTFGPSFVAAQCQLLPSIVPQKVNFGRLHPPVSWRINLILRAAAILNVDVLPPEGHPARSSVKVFWDQLKSSRISDQWFDVISDEQLEDALTGLTQLLGAHPPSSYSSPDFDSLESLIGSLRRGVPPIGFRIDAANKPKCKQIDFRSILYAGWIASAQSSEAPFDLLHTLARAHDHDTTFELINKLCGHAILQQRAINIHMGA